MRFYRFDALILIVIISPLLIIITLLTLTFNGWPIIFKQLRVGKNFSSFYIFKFRSMVVNNDDVLVTSKGDMRVTRFGNFIRKYKIDELPQLYNIFIGDMCFIGPRPEVPKYVDKNKFKFLKKIKPGLSDFASIIFRNEEDLLASKKLELSYNKLLEMKIKLSNIYSENKSLLLDFKLIVITIISIFSPNFAVKYTLKNFIFDLDSGLHENLYALIYGESS